MRKILIFICIHFIFKYFTQIHYHKQQGDNGAQVLTNTKISSLCKVCVSDAKFALIQYPKQSGLSSSKCVYTDDIPQAFHLTKQTHYKTMLFSFLILKVFQYCCFQILNSTWKETQKLSKFKATAISYNYHHKLTTNKTLFICCQCHGRVSSIIHTPYHHLAALAEKHTFLWAIKPVWNRNTCPQTHLWLCRTCIAMSTVELKLLLHCGQENLLFCPTAEATMSFLALSLTTVGLRDARLDMDASRRLLLVVLLEAGVQRDFTESMEVDLPESNKKWNLHKCPFFLILDIYKSSCRETRWNIAIFIGSFQVC